MQDQYYSATLPFLLPKKRGRPVTGNAKSPAQRKQMQRAREILAAADAVGHELEATDKALIAVLQQNREHTAHRAWLALGLKNGWIDSARMDCVELLGDCK